MTASSVPLNIVCASWDPCKCRSMTLLFDQLHLMDSLKAAKVSLADDITLARHLQQQQKLQQPDFEDDNDYDGLLEFLEDTWWCIKLLHSCTKQVNYQHRVVGRLAQFICDSLTDKVLLYCTAAPESAWLHS